MIDIFATSGNSIGAQMESLAARVKLRRLEFNLSQAGLAKRADLPLPTYRLFEQTGKISLHGLLQIAFALNCLQDFDELFSQRQFTTLDEVLDNKDIKRKYGRKQ